MALRKIHIPSLVNGKKSAKNSATSLGLTPLALAILINGHAQLHHRVVHQIIGAWRIEILVVFVTVQGLRVRLGDCPSGHLADDIGVQEKLHSTLRQGREAQNCPLRQIPSHYGLFSNFWHPFCSLFES